MKKYAFLTFSLMLMLMVVSISARAQTGAVREPDKLASLTDAALEADMKENLEAARLYFKLRKAYRASVMRSEEIIAGYPSFSRMDEALYIAGMSHFYLSQKKGKQPPTLTPEKHLAEAQKYLLQLADDFSDSEFFKKAEDELKPFGGFKAVSSKQ
ncbi:MAG: hypothetical protein ACRD9R_08475 [Pyrinomonadaceae bacterium]